MAQVISRGPGNLVRGDQISEGAFVMHLARVMVLSDAVM